ncbi:UvrD-helicase domain-containing protein [Nonomuraea bangladeshensis]|uniref:UvrD-helicase domain-containing protein n=1 Tax=Nonomuraea bangladeshensis TaxID=404385 RepID=UPI003C2D0AD4
MFSQPTPYAEVAAPLFTVPQPPIHTTPAPAPVRFEHKPTGEQQAILDAAATGRPLTIEAGAGTGKTSTLKMLAAAAVNSAAPGPGRRMLYLAYNRAIADEAMASFPANTDCRTAHSLAFRQVGHQFKDRLNGPRLPAREVARFLRIPAVLDLGAHALTSVKVARIVTDAVRAFCYSADDQPGPWHIAAVPGLEGDGMQLLREQALPFLQRAWEDLTTPGGRLKFEHDHYLKLWALTRPNLPYSAVLLDEAQDANPVIARVVEQQAAQRILVGDQSQAIYGWRGAVDAMSSFDGQRLALSQSFRFGQPIADEANQWLELLDAPLRLTGNPGRDSMLGVAKHADAVLCRTNAGAVGQAMAALDVQLRPALVGGGDDIRRLAKACQDLRTGRGTEHPELMAFSSWDEVREYAEHDAGGADLKTLVKLVDSHGPDEILRVVDRLVDEHNADIVISTAHRAKGREWGKVRLAGDWQEPYDKDGKLNRSEAMLSYVAVTRAKELLDCRTLKAAEAGGIGFKVLVDDEERAVIEGEREAYTALREAGRWGSRAERAAALVDDAPAVHRTTLGATGAAPATEDSAAMDTLTPDPPRVDTDLPAELVGWLQLAKDAAAHEASWKAVKEQAQQKLKDWLGDREEATVAGRPAVSWKTSKPGGQLDAKQLQADHPDIYAAYYKPKKASRPFNLIGEWK